MRRIHPAIGSRAAGIAALLASLVPVTAGAQQGSIDGIVASASTGAPLEGVAVVVEDAAGSELTTLTDRNGFYQIGNVRPGSHSLRGQHLGYAEHRQTVVVPPGERLTVNFSLEPGAVALEGVVVSAARGAAVRDLGRQRVTPGDLRLVPVPGGSGDLASYLQTLPGVVTTGDRGGQLFVRGGTPASNLVLVDGIPIYQPFHIVGFFSAFPEELVSSVDFYAGGFGARYHGRTSSVLDVGLRDGNPNQFRVSGSVSPFVAEAVVEGPLADGISWMASARRSLLEETSEPLLGEVQPLAFESQLVKLTATVEDELRCSVLGLRTSDRGRLDAAEEGSHVAWENLLVGGRCVAQLTGFLRLVESNFSFSQAENSAVSRGSSNFTSRVWRMQHDGHVTSMVGAMPLYAGYELSAELPRYELEELFGVAGSDDAIFGFSGYLEPSVRLGRRVEIRPGVVLTSLPRAGVEPRVRASWEPFGRSTERLQGAVGLYRQQVMGTSDMRDVGSVFTAWMRTPDNQPVEAVHALLGWQQSWGGVNWSVEGYYKWLEDIPVPIWSGVAKFTTTLGRARGEAYGADARIEYSAPGFHGFIGYGYGQTTYEAAQAEFGDWFGSPVQSYHPPHDRRHQLNAVANLEWAGFDGSFRWQLGSGLPFTRPLGFDEAFDYTVEFPDFTEQIGTPRMVLDRPFTGRLPAMHRLDLSVARGFDLGAGRLTAQVGVINAYDRRNMFYYDLFSGRRVDQLPLAPYASIGFQSR